MANFPCQDCTYMKRYTDANGTTHMRRTCAEARIVCSHMNSAVPCKRSNCCFWNHANSVNGITWCNKCQQAFDHTHDYDTTLTCKACLLPATFDLYNDDDLEFVLSLEDYD